MLDLGLWMMGYPQVVSASGATFVLSLPSAPADAGPAPAPELVEADG